jgi:hypothetical protein
MASTDPTAPKPLNISCVIGAVNLPEVGSIQSVQSRNRQQKDKTNTITATYSHQIERSTFSKKLDTLASGTGGIIPKLNLNIGAPACTFGEGAIGPDMAHPVLDLLSGASKSKFGNATYVVPAGSPIIEQRLTESITNTPNNVLDDQMLRTGGSGFIPFYKRAPYTDLTTRTTYNIWQQVTRADFVKTFFVNLGVTNYEPNGYAHISTQYNGTGSQVTVHAQNTKCLVKRVFPIADDLLYESPNIYFSKVGDVAVVPKVVQAKGGVNCGFWLRFNHTKPSAFIDGSDSTPENSSIVINFGKSGKSKYISNFSIFLQTNRLFLRYENPFNGNLVEIPLQGKTLGLNNSTEFDVFVHFAGPNMYIGFDPDVSTWNSIEPQKLNSESEKTNYGEYSECRIPKDSIIQILFANLQCSYTYSPICFDNLNYEEVNSTNTESFNGISVTGTQGHGKIKIHGDVAVGTDTFTESALNTDLFTRKNPTNVLNDPASDLKQTTKEAPTYYSDWRRINDGKGGIISDSDYIKNPEFYYRELNRARDNSLPQNPRFSIDGAVTFNTTIEGPVFFYLRNYTTTTDKKVSGINKPLWGEYSDVTGYLVSVRVDEEFDNKNLSYRRSNATLVFRNMTNDLIGRQILNALQENILTFTIKAGYGNDKHTFFQGMTKSVKVLRQPDKYEIEIKCDDIGDTLLSGIHFNVVNPVSLHFRTYQYILEDCFEFAGLAKYYMPRSRVSDFDVLYDIYFNQYTGLPQYQNALSSRVISASRDKKIKDIVQNLLAMMIHVSSPTGANLANNLPVIYWNPEKELFELTTRGADNAEELFFAGDATVDGQGITYLVNSNPEGLHGLATDSGWTEETNVNNLHSQVVLIHQNFDGYPSIFNSNNNFINQAVGDSAYNRLNALVGPNVQYQEVLGYVGFNKDDYYNDQMPPNSGLIQSKILGKQIFDARENVARRTFQSLSVNVYVTKPLKSYGKFKIKSFAGGVEFDTTEEYIYSSVSYEIDVDKNLIKARVEGSYFPQIT